MSPTIPNHHDCSMAQQEQAIRLRNVVNQGRFFELPFDTILFLIKAAYSHELETLKSAYSVKSTNPEPVPKTPSPSQILYRVDYDEINRTLTSIQSLFWIARKDYTSFVGVQAAETRLSVTSFEWMVALFENTIETSEDLYTLITSIIINDLRKSPSLATDYYTITHIDVAKDNHDVILYKAIRDCPHLVPSLQHLRPQQREDLTAGVKLAATLNFGQLAQAENVPASLTGLEAMRGRPHAFNMHFLEQTLDVAGAAGHVTHGYAAKLIEPVFESYRIAHDVAQSILRHGTSLRVGYDLVLKHKVRFLEAAGWAESAFLHVGKAEHRALMRLLCIGGASSVDDANLIYKTFHHGLLDEERELLVQGLNRDGSAQHPAIQATYIPAMYQIAIQNTSTGSDLEKYRALSAVLRYLAKLLRVDDVEAGRLFPKVMVIERDVRAKLWEPLISDRFRQAPNIVDRVELPEFGPGMGVM